MPFRSVRTYAVIVWCCCVLLYHGTPRADERAWVRWVDDGDTIVLADGRRIRYIGINAPEIGHDDTEPEPLGPEAKHFNTANVFQKYVRLEFDHEKNDHYGRTLAYIFNPAGMFINRAMLLNGYAYYLYRFPNVKYDAILLAAQRSAMRDGKVIWHNWKETKRRYIGNRASRRFHLQHCPLAQKIAPHNRVYFTKKWDAFWQGYSPAKNCLQSGLSQ